MEGLLTRCLLLQVLADLQLPAPSQLPLVDDFELCSVERQSPPPGSLVLGADLDVGCSMARWKAESIDLDDQHFSHFGLYQHQKIRGLNC